MGTTSSVKGKTPCHSVRESDLVIDPVPTRLLSLRVSDLQSECIAIAFVLGRLLPWEEHPTKGEKTETESLYPLAEFRYSKNIKEEMDRC